MRVSQQLVVAFTLTCCSSLLEAVLSFSILVTNDTKIKAPINDPVGGQASVHTYIDTASHAYHEKKECGRRNAIAKMGLWLVTSSSSFPAIIATVTTSMVVPLQPAHAYEPDPDPIQESLYLLCRVQEATLLQERYINKQRPPIQKMKLTLRLVERSYRIMDQINFLSKVIPDEDLVVAVQAGNEAAESLQDAIDFVKAYDAKDASSMTNEQRDFLIEALTTTRERLFGFVSYLPDASKLEAARKRVEEENRLNREEFDPDLANDAGVYNPIVLPWINRNNNKDYDSSAS
ncbi:hypothetical protein ACA910_000258 [Epithemia clementina (nom. ined.)]